MKSLLLSLALCACSPGIVHTEFENDFGKDANTTDAGDTLPTKDVRQTDLGNRSQDTGLKDMSRQDVVSDLGNTPDLDGGMDLSDQGGNQECPSLKTISAVEKTLTSGENYALKNIKIDGEHNKKGVFIRGVAGSGNTLIIEDSVFLNTNWAIHTRNVDNIEIRGNYFEEIGNTMRFDKAVRVTVQYNKVKNFGVLPFENLGGSWSGNFVQVTSSQLKIYDVSYNLVDRSSDPRANKHTNVYAEDYININHSVFVREGANKYGRIHHNYLRGSVDHNESISAGAIIFDQECEHFRVENNVMVNTGQYLMGNANSDDIEFIDNQGFIEWKHDFATLAHSHSSSNKSGPNQVVGVITQEYGSGNIGSTLFKGNRILAERSNAEGQAFSYYFNWFPEGTNTFSNNNFDASSPTGGPNSAPNGTSIIADDMFGTYGKGSNYFQRSCL